MLPQLTLQTPCLPKSEREKTLNTKTHKNLSQTKKAFLVALMNHDSGVEQQEVSLYHYFSFQLTRIRGKSKKQS